MEGFFDLLRLTLRNADRNSLTGLIKPVFAFFLDVFDLRHRLQQQGVEEAIVNGIEESAIGSFLELVTKLNEATFKPLFIRLYDWAVIDLAEGKRVDDGRLVERKIVLLHVMKGLLEKFRHLLTPYMTTVFPHLEEILPSFANGSLSSVPLYTLVMEVIAKSVEVDDGGFWVESTYRKLLPLLPPLFPSTAIAALPQAPLLDMIRVLPSNLPEPLLKSLSTSLLLLTRSDLAGERLAALAALEAFWSRAGEVDEMVGLVPETVGEFLSELLEDENSDVERAARGVLAKIEAVTGSLKEYLE